MPWHYLKDNRSTSQPTQHVVFDTETIPEPCPEEIGCYSHRWRLAHAIGWRWERGQQSRRVQIHTARPGALWAFVEGWLDHNRTTWVWSHNLGFDLTVSGFWERWEKGEYSIHEPAARRNKRWKKKGKHRELPGFACLEDPPVILKLWHQSGARVTFLDTLNYWKMPLADLGKLAGREKWQLPDWHAPYAEWAGYCKNDCEILEQAVLAALQFVSQHNLGKMRYTAPAQAMSAYRHRFKSHAILFHDDKSARKLERDSYYNGRCEAFFRGRVVAPDAVEWFGVRSGVIEREVRIESAVYHLDVSALYPSVMAANVFPCKLIGHLAGDGLTVDLLPAPVEHCIARVTLDTQIPFPVRMRGRGTLFATGRFTTTLAGPELAQAVLGGFVKKWEEVACYQCVDLFSAYVGYFWGERLRYESAGDTARAELCKLFMNSLYGKFAQRTPEWIDRPDLAADEEWGAYTLSLYANQPGYAEQARAFAEENPDWLEGEPIVRSYRALAGHVQELHRRLDCDQSLTAIAAFVTAYGRVAMERSRKLAGYRNVFYQGVDSLHVSEEGHRRLQNKGAVRERSLGFLRPEAVYNNVKYWGAMDYQADGKIVRCGWKSRGDFIGENDWRQNNFQGIASTIAARPTGQILETSVKLTHRPQSSGAKVGHDGWIEAVTLPD